MSVLKSLQERRSSGLQESAKTATSLKEAVAVEGRSILAAKGWENRFSKLTEKLETGNQSEQYIAGVTAKVIKNLHEQLDYVYTTRGNGDRRLGEATVSSSLGNMASLTPRVIDIVGNNISC
jgi:hypothetical protein